MDALHNGSARLDWLMDSFVRETPDVLRAITVSQDGLRLAKSSGLNTDLADQLAAVIGGVSSLTVGASRLLTSGRVRYTLVDMYDGVLLVMAVGDRAMVGVHASIDCDLSQVSFETARLVHRVAEALQPALRHHGSMA